MALRWHLAAASIHIMSTRPSKLGSGDSELGSRLTIERAPRLPSPPHLAAVAEPSRIAMRAEPSSRFPVICLRDEWNRDTPGSSSQRPLGQAPERPLYWPAQQAVYFVATFVWPTAGFRHSTWILAARITLPHFSVSSAMNVPNAADVIGAGSMPKPASRALILGSAATALIALLSVSTTSAGVSLGAPTPYHWLAS